MLKGDMPLTLPGKAEGAEVNEIIINNRNAFLSLPGET